MGVVLVINGGQTTRVDGVAALLVLLVSEKAGELTAEAGEITLTWGSHQAEMYATRKVGVRQRDK